MVFFLVGLCVFTSRLKTHNVSERKNENDLPLSRIAHFQHEKFIQCRFRILKKRKPTERNEQKILSSLSYLFTTYFQNMPIHNRILTNKNVKFINLVIFLTIIITNSIKTKYNIYSIFYFLFPISYFLSPDLIGSFYYVRRISFIQGQFKFFYT